MQNWAQQDKTQQQIITFIKSTSFGRKYSNKASSWRNVDSVVGCSLKLFRSLAIDCFATLPKVNMKAQISELQPGIILFVLNIAIATGFNLMRWSFSMQPIKCTVTALIPWGRGSNQSATQFKFWTDFSHGNEVACLCDQRSVSGALSNRKHGLFHIRYFEPGYSLHCSVSNYTLKTLIS